MPYRYNKNSHLGILNLSKNPIITNTIAPFTLVIGHKRFTVLPWIYTANEIFFYPPINQRSDRFIYLF